MDVSSPPQYRRFSRPGSNELPPYSRCATIAQPLPSPPREPTEHVFQVVDGKTKPWIKLTLRSSAKSAKSLPTFFEKENINGQLEVDAERGDSIQAITAHVTGRVITGSSIHDSFVFLNISLPIWAKSMDTPRIPSPSQGTTSNKLVGHCVWPLSIPLPRTVTVPTGSGDMRSCRLPETFLERNTRVSVQYDLTINVSRGMLRSDNRIRTAFGYIPSSRPGAPSLIRQLAYQQFLPIPSPTVDPDGWKVLRPVIVRGTIRGSKRIEINSTLSIAKPLCYARGTVIPLFLTLEGRDSQTMDLLATPNAISVSLRRRVRFFNKTCTSREDVAWNESVSDVVTAVWWPSTTQEVRLDATTRYLGGEIRLQKDLRPTSEMGHFSISYAVVFSPFKTVGFESESTTLLHEPVEIATLHPRGIRMNAYAPPAYDAGRGGHFDDFALI